MRNEKPTKRELKHSKIIQKEVEELNRVTTPSFRKQKPWIKNTKIATQTRIPTISTCTHTHTQRQKRQEVVATLRLEELPPAHQPGVPQTQRYYYFRTHTLIIAKRSTTPHHLRQIQNTNRIRSTPWKRPPPRPLQDPPPQIPMPCQLCFIISHFFPARTESIARTAL